MFPNMPDAPVLFVTSGSTARLPLTSRNTLSKSSKVRQIRWSRNQCGFHRRSWQASNQGNSTSEDPAGSNRSLPGAGSETVERVRGDCQKGLGVGEEESQVTRSGISCNQFIVTPRNSKWRFWKRRCEWESAMTGRRWQRIGASGE